MHTTLRVNNILHGISLIHTVLLIPHNTKFMLLSILYMPTHRYLYQQTMDRTIDFDER